MVFQMCDFSCVSPPHAHFVFKSIHACVLYNILCFVVAGSGKTAAFLVPVLSQIYASGPIQLNGTSTNNKVKLCLPIVMLRKCIIIKNH